MCLSQTVLAERDNSKGFQLQKSLSFDTETTQKRHLKRRNTPQYRVICTYSKSTKQYWKERNRRQQVLKLSLEGKGTREIALTLGVTSRTVLRDMAKLHRYLIGQIRRKQYLLDEQRKQELTSSLTSTSLEERFKRLSKLMFLTQKLSKKEEFEQHNKVFFVDMDHLTPAGFPSFKMDKSSSTFKTPYHIHLVGVKDGKTQSLGGVTIN